MNESISDIYYRIGIQQERERILKIIDKLQNKKKNQFIKENSEDNGKEVNWVDDIQAEILGVYNEIEEEVEKRNE